MSERDWRLYVEDILEAINFIEDYIENYTFERFISDRKTIDAVIRNLEIIGEASKHIPKGVKDKNITEELPILEKEFIKIKNERDFDF